MAQNDRFFSVRKKMYIFVVIAVLLVALGTSVIVFAMSVSRVDDYYRQSATDNARNFASIADVEFLDRLRDLAQSQEYQQLRERAEKENNEELITQYLKDNGMLDEYMELRGRITKHLNNIEDMKYIYIVVPGTKEMDTDMYLVDDEETKLFELGYYEEREPELKGLDLVHLKEPVISHGNWGWLCSAFEPVYADDGRCICLVGCDFGMDDVMKERTSLLIYLIVGALAFTVLVLTGSVLFINKVVVKPLDAMTTEMKRFNPSEYTSYKDAGVMELDINSNDEIGEIYKGIRTMQINIIDYLNDMSVLIDDKEKAERDIEDKERQIGRLSEETYRDALTGVGSKSAYIKKIDELNEAVSKDNNTEFALVMVDMNHLKQVNDDYGHKSGDQYIIGCCRMVCEAFKHSPVYRIGGDEFVVILQGADYDDRKEIFEKLRADFEKSFQRKELDPWCRYSAALGMAERASDDITAELVFKRADKAMYDDKMRFKNRYGNYR